MDLFHQVHLYQDDQQNIVLLIDGKPLPFTVSDVHLSISSDPRRSTLSLTIPAVALALGYVNCHIDIPEAPTLPFEDYRKLWTDIFGDPAEPEVQENIEATAEAILHGNISKFQKFTKRLSELLVDPPISPPET